VTNTTRRLLNYWQRADRERKLFFCQIEALETIIYITEIARKDGATWIENELRRANDEANPLLYRTAFKMATGSGKTVVMAMLIAWHTLNKLADPQNALFSDAFLIATPGITIRDRLRVLLPGDPNNYYRQLDVVPSDTMAEMGKAKIVITNFHAFKPRERQAANRLTKEILRQGETSPFTETYDQVARRVCRELGNKRNIIVLNDEAHHCYRPKPDDEKLTGDERKEAEQRTEQARVWISGLEAVKAKIGIRALYDLSATPFFLRGSGYSKLTADGKKISEGILFPWVVSDFSLIDAIECGIVKVPRVPVDDNAVTGELPAYRDIWPRIRDHLPKKGRGTEAVSGEPKLPVELEGALQTLYGNYEKYYRLWEQNTEAQARGLTPPVFIVVANNTNVSKLIFDYIAGWDTGKQHPDDSPVLAPGKLALFSNVAEAGGRWLARPNTILVDSEQLESDEGMSAEFKKIAAGEIEEFKAEYRARFPGRDADSLTDEDLLREVMNTVGKVGKLGEYIRCVVSVSMLTEGWDAQTVTHILGVRAFGTQLLCEQVVGRGLRRTSYAANEGMFEPEYAEVYGVPFSFIPTAGSAAVVKAGPMPTHVRALEERIACEITFPRLTGYRYDLPTERLDAAFTNDSRMALSTATVPTVTESAPIVGESIILTLDDLKRRRIPEVEFLLAKLVLEKYFRQDGEECADRPAAHKFDAEVQAWLFPQVLRITRRWLSECVTCKDDTFKQMLLLIEWAHDAADRIYRAIERSSGGDSLIKPILRPYDTLGSTQYVEFDTIKPTYAARPDKCHLNYVVADTQSWEQKMAQGLEYMDEVKAYVKNQGLGFTIPYTLDGDEHDYLPDFIARVDDGHGPDDLLNLIVEVSGKPDKAKPTKVATARTLWVPAINNHGGFGRWAFIEVTDPWDAKNTIRAFLKGEAVDGVGALLRQTED
jgi:type III restriction enzyme